MERCKNVFEAILKYGHDEDWLPNPKANFDAAKPLANQLRAWHKINVSFSRSRGDGVIPLPVECVPPEIDPLHLLLRDLDP